MKRIEVNTEELLKYQWIAIRASSKFSIVNYVVSTLEDENGKRVFDKNECAYLKNLSQNIIFCCRQATKYMIEYYRIKDKVEIYGSGSGTRTILNSLLMSSINEMSFGTKSLVKYFKKLGFDIVKDHKEKEINSNYRELLELRNRLQHRDNNNGDDKYLHFSYFDDDDPIVNHDGRPFDVRYAENPFKTIYGEPERLVFKELSKDSETLGEIVYDNIDSLVVWALQFIDSEILHFDQVFSNNEVYRSIKIVETK